MFTNIKISNMRTNNNLPYLNLSCFGCSDVTEDVENCMGTNGLRSSYLEMSVTVLQVHGHILCLGHRGLCCC